MKHIAFLLAFLVILSAACSQAAPATPEATLPPVEPPIAAVTDTATETPVPLGPLTLTSDAFADEGDIPARFGQVNFQVPMGNASFVCDNSAESVNVSPALQWVNVPPDAKSLVLLLWDQMNYAMPDVPETARFPHWVIFNIPPASTGLPEGVPAEPTLADGSVQAKNAYPAPYDVGYGGPCPGGHEKHLYIFTLYALDITLDITLDMEAGAQMNAVLDAMEGHILAQAGLKGYFTGP